MVLLTGVMLCLCSSAEAGCRIEEPRFEGADPDATATISLECVEGEQPGYVVYPSGPLYVGMSMFAVDGEAGEASAVADGQEYNVEADEIQPGQSVVLKLGQVDPTLTHFVVAVWSEVVDCAFIEADRCFGPFDNWLYPIPVDTWPRPACDVPKLREIGYFDWTSGPEADPSFFQAPEELANLAGEVDCFGVDQTSYGLGLSLRSWRVAPLPTGFR